MKKDLNPLANGAITVPGAHQLTLAGIRWAGEPTDDEFAKIRTQSAVIDRVNAWMSGDVVAMQVRREQYRRPGLTVKTIIHDFAQAEGMSFDLAYERYCVAEAFPWVERSTRLQWSHHRVIWAAVEGKAERKRWIAAAEEGGWGVQELRAAIMAERRVAVSAPEPTVPGLFPLELQTAVDWASSRLDDVDQLTPEQAAEQFANLMPIFDYAARLRARAEAKESIKPAA